MAGDAQHVHPQGPLRAAAQLTEGRPSGPRSRKGERAPWRDTLSFDAAGMHPRISTSNAHTTAQGSAGHHHPSIIAAQETQPCAQPQCVPVFGPPSALPPVLSLVPNHLRLGGARCSMLRAALHLHKAGEPCPGVRPAALPAPVHGPPSSAHSPAHFFPNLFSLPCQAPFFPGDCLFFTPVRAQPCCLSLPLLLRCASAAAIQVLGMDECAPRVRVRGVQPKSTQPDSV